jgi:hypothetical protein
MTSKRESAATSSISENESLLSQLDGSQPPTAGLELDRGVAKRPSSLLGTLKFIRSAQDHEEFVISPLSGNSNSRLEDQSEQTERLKTILRHGEVQTSSSLFRRKKEYLVLTETHLMRFKSLHRAADAFTE